MGLSSMWRRIRFGEPVIVVSGLPRSGTSMAMKMLDAAGVDTTTDGERTADEDNPKGYFEDERVKDLENLEDLSWIRDSRGKAIKVISFLLKTLPAENNYKVIFMRRDLDEVLASQKKMLERRGEEDTTDDKQMRELWKNHLWRSNYMLKNQAQFESIEILYSDVLANPEKNARLVAEFIGGLDARKMAEVVDPNLYRNRAAS